MDKKEYLQVTLRVVSIAAAIYVSYALYKIFVVPDQEEEQAKSLTDKEAQAAAQVAAQAVKVAVEAEAAAQAAKVAVIAAAAAQAVKVAVIAAEAAKEKRGVNQFLKRINALHLYEVENGTFDKGRCLMLTLAQATPRKTIEKVFVKSDKTSEAQLWPDNQKKNPDDLFLSSNQVDLDKFQMDSFFSEWKKRHVEQLNRSKTSAFSPISGGK
jgi:hypothetical protein